jgi:hypothetical protein
MRGATNGDASNGGIATLRRLGGIPTLAMLYRWWRQANPPVNASDHGMLGLWK